MPLLFQRNQSLGLDAIYHFKFTGKEEYQATVIIKDQTIHVENGHIGTANIHITADSYTWLQFLAKEQNIVWALIRRKIRIRGSLRLLQAFGKCFPS